jgi:hypothetical protein
VEGNDPVIISQLNPQTHVVTIGVGGVTVHVIIKLHPVFVDHPLLPLQDHVRPVVVWFKPVSVHDVHKFPVPQGIAQVFAYD